ncbi:hypothetical protein [Hymenobacter coccineus]|uniref:hypothetical protein n=1 Tax=Hymenobacter coccineus TaxID=1908235 RepID=UPI000F78B6B0|nr:hypothetical protein [Hymenobacter coccineus]
MHNKGVKVSVIITVDDDFSGLRATVQSVISQVYPEVECIVLVLSGSTELTHVSLPNEVALLVNNGEGAAALLHSGIVQASGEYILLLPAGAVLCNENSIAQLLIPSAYAHGIIYGNLERIFPDGKQDTLTLPSQITAETFRGVEYNILPAALVRKSLLIKYDFYDSRINYLQAWAFIVKAVLLGHESYIHSDICVTKVAVSRTGNWYKLSNIHLIALEYARLDTELALFTPVKKESSQTIGAPEPNSRIANAWRQSASHFTKNIRYSLRSLRSRFELEEYRKKHHQACLNIPIIINNRNHVTYLKRLIASLEKRGYHNIHILDNASTYQPLLDFYNNTQYNVFRLPNNVGFCALWDSPVFDYFKDQYYVYTDSDLELVEECPDDFMVVMHYLLHKYSLGKAGFSLLTNDLPDTYANKAEVQKWEKQHQIEKVERLAFAAPIDTTFALYKPNTFGPAGILTAFRTRFPYSARHLPWYENTRLLTPEQSYYYDNAKTSSHWTSKIKRT